MDKITEVLNALGLGSAEPTHELVRLIYSELHQMAVARLRHDRLGQSLQATELVNEVYLRLCSPAAVAHEQTHVREIPGTSDAADPHDTPAATKHRWQNRAHFFGAAAEAMRRILIEAARRHQSLKRGGQWQRQDLEWQSFAVESSAAELLAVNDLLDQLAAVDPPAAQLVKLRVFAGFGMSEIAEMLDISPRSATDLWSYAKAWLKLRIQETED